MASSYFAIIQNNISSYFELQKKIPKPKGNRSGPKVLIDCLTIFLGAEKCRCSRIRGKNEKLSY